jgi:hypothetical protein
MKNRSRFFIITLIAAFTLLLNALAITSPAVTTSGDYSSAVITENRADVSYAITPSFDVELDASYGEFDTNRDGTNDFTGIAVDMRVTNISEALSHGIAGIDARLCFDNTRLEPLYKTSKELNGSTLEPSPVVTNFPTYTVKIPAAGLVLDVFSIEGLCKAYAHTDGSYHNPDNENQVFTGLESYISCNYVINLDTHVAYKENKVGLLSSDNVSFRYYFKVLDESGAGGSYTFTVPDSPEVAPNAIGSLALKAPHYTGGTPAFSNVAGRGDSVTIKLWNDDVTTPENTTEDTTAVTEENTTEVTTAPATKPETTPAAPSTETTADITTDITTEVTTDITTDVTTEVTGDVTSGSPTDNTTVTPVETTPAEDTTLTPSDTTAKPDDAGVSDDTTAPSPEATTTPTSDGDSCGSFAYSAFISALAILLVSALFITRTEKTDE